MGGSLGCGVVWNTLVLATLTGVISTLLGLAMFLFVSTLIEPLFLKS